MNYEPVTQAIIDLDAFRHNVEVVRKKHPNSKIIIPVKANAYGHDSVIISKACQKMGIDYLAIARLKEGLRLRENGITLPIISLGVESGINIEFSLLKDIELSVSYLSNLLEIEEYAKKNNIIAKIHVKIDTGMTRLGCKSGDIIEIVKNIQASKNLKFVSLYTHLARSEESKQFTEKQIDLFLKVKDALKYENITPQFYHMYNSGAILDSYGDFKEFAVRPGIMVYGYSPYANNDDSLKPVMTLKSKVIALKNVNENIGVSYNHRFITTKPTILATIPVGYGDGIRRDLTNKLFVTINGKHYPQRGTITMDLMVIEVDES
ncbi:MAG TPA: alanine racemase, partial [Spirochaetota bacterium]|nr:alanine racemase [Spirochaetota bacterium]